MRSSTHTTAPDQEAGSDGDDNEKDKKRESNTSCYTNHSGCREREGQREGETIKGRRIHLYVWIYLIATCFSC